MVRRLVAAIVLLLLGVTPSLALVCYARCLSEHTRPGLAGSAGDAHADHARHAGHSGTAESSAAVSRVPVAATLISDAPAHHGCVAAVAEGTLDRQPITAGLAHLPAGPSLAALMPAAISSVRQTPHTTPGARPGRASVPLRI